MQSVKVLLAEDLSMIRGALIALLELEPDLRVVTSVGRGDAIVPAAVRSRPDVAVIDMALPGGDGLSAAAALHERVPTCRTLILTALGQPGAIRRALSTGVSGLLFKDAPPDQLSKAVRAVAAGGRFIDPELALSAWDVQENPLSPREREVLRFAAQGADTAEIAGCLYLSVGTVRNYLTTIVAKLNARNRIDAVRIATQAGWIS
ncbi:response regulator transcription factor [Streptomyces litchfieldiae]|uniref:Response regulator transcription factor n=1 Tax=Streptomyces litchfieldiae TaxID=3075543 RepID=A0ABU2MZF0_9ACTN|nr:response regulator transcription factor [Streptomyces sp. DSM 44938]MDT0346915.1 response regulator transcription factor [Streptomyces sp. DSM 44938]